MSNILDRPLVRALLADPRCRGLGSLHHSTLRALERRGLVTCDAGRWRRTKAGDDLAAQIREEFQAEQAEQRKRRAVLVGRFAALGISCVQPYYPDLVAPELDLDTAALVVVHLERMDAIRRGEGM